MINIKSIFDIISDGFFNPLAISNKRFYEAFILKLFSLINELKEDNNRVLIEDSLSAFLDDHPNIIFESQDEEIESLNNEERVKYAINYLIKTGWIFEENMGRGVIAIQFEEYAHKIINSLIEIKEEREVKFNHYLKIIEDRITYHKKGMFEDLEIISDQSDQLVMMLRSLNSNIQRYYNNIIKNKDKDELEEVVKTFLEYKYDYFDKTYFKYKTEESSKKSFRQINEQVNSLRNEYYSLYISNIIDEKNVDNIEANKLFKKNIDNIISNIKEIRYLDESIDRRNQQYTITTINKISYLINRSADIKGLLNNIIDITVNHEEEDFSFINIFNVTHYSYDQISKPREKVIHEEVLEQIDYKEVSDDYLKEQLKIHKDNLKYSFDNINEFILSKLEDNDYITGNDFPINNQDDFLKLIIAIMYHTVDDVLYTFKPLEEIIVNNNYEFKDFIIRRKQNVK